MFYILIQAVFIWSLRVNALLTSRYTTDWTSLHCPEDPVTVLPTPTYGYDNAVFTVCTENFINASAELIYSTLIDFKSYHLWNSFVVDVKVPPNVTDTPEDVYIGMPMIFTSTGLIPLINTTSDETVTVLDNDADEGYLLASWGVLVISEHPSILVSQGDGVTRYLSFETYYQPLLTAALLALRPALQKQFVQQGDDLRTYVESLV
ncbi:hypothetical protein VM1G_09418 [Cytospora mali]|uniref:Uncharacterized protein n=1 Tax=Cytospora mali TaxID=578113 RepID=A0A0M5I7F9_CYTMA|nr:hypothetical protein [Valsa mali]KUI73703.1 hypothetical protein VM1G_09418 [Valsa mali]